MSYYYYHEEKNKDQVVFVFHGTGGNEESLLPIVNYLFPNSSIISIRGDVVENGMLRYFKRFSPDEIDLEDLDERSIALVEFIEELIEKHDYQDALKISIGYSNGANIITAMNSHKEKLFDINILSHGKKYLSKELAPQLKSKVFISVGINDPLIPYEDTLSMADEYTKSYADVYVYSHQKGHSLDIEEIEAMKKWLLG